MEVHVAATDDAEAEAVVDAFRELLPPRGSDASVDGSTYLCDLYAVLDGRVQESEEIEMGFV